MVAVVRGETKEKARAIVESCIEGGIKAIELTFTVPFAHRVIEDLAMQYGDKILLGAGTVLDPETANCNIIGGKICSCPHFNPDTTKLCNRYRIANMAGF